MLASLSSPTSTHQSTSFTVHKLIQLAFLSVWPVTIRRPFCRRNLPANSTLKNRSHGPTNSNPSNWILPSPRRTLQTIRASCQNICVVFVLLCFSYCCIGERYTGECHSEKCKVTTNSPNAERIFGFLHQPPPLTIQASDHHERQRWKLVPDRKRSGRLHRTNQGIW